MTTFYIKTRRTSPILYSSVEAETREEAVTQAVAAVPPEEQVEVMEVSEVEFDKPPLEGAPTDAPAKSRK